MINALKDLAERINGELVGDPELEILGAADIQDAVDGDIVFAESPKLLDEAEKSSASAIITFHGAVNNGKPLILVANPRLAFAKVLEVFIPQQNRISGIHPTCVVGEGTIIGENPSIGFNSYIGNNCEIDENAWIFPFVYIGDNVRLGKNCVLHPFVTIYDDVTIGENAIIHSGSVIGADGFGYTPCGQSHYKIPQIGSVVIGKDVEVGANVTIDRARTGKTVIGSGTKIDNLAHIAHNVIIGENCVIVAQTGISGSVTIGDRVILAGQSGVADHVTIGDDSIILAKSGVLGDVKPGSFVSGVPIRPHKDQLRIYAAQAKLPEMLHTVRKLEKRIEELEERLRNV